jgi:hypothetical protein
MSEDIFGLPDRQALEKAAKYICNLKDGLCLMVVENMICRKVCTLDTLPWQCWLTHFKRKAVGEDNYSKV